MLSVPLTLLVQALEPLVEHREIGEDELFIESSELRLELRRRAGVRIDEASDDGDHGVCVLQLGQQRQGKQRRLVRTRRVRSLHVDEADRRVGGLFRTIDL